MCSVKVSWPQQPLGCILLQILSLLMEYWKSHTHVTPVIDSIIPNDVMLPAPRPTMGTKFWALHALLKCYTARCTLSAFVLEAGKEPAVVRTAFSFYHVGSKDYTEVRRLGSKHLYPQTASPTHFL